MKRTTAIFAGAALLLGGAYLAVRPTRAAAATVATQRDRQPQVRTLSGLVSDGGGSPLSGAVVYLKNTRTLAVKTYIAQDDGKYQFNSLSPNADYEVYAEHNGKRSSTKTLSSFDSRAQAVINLKVE